MTPAEGGSQKKTPPVVHAGHTPHRRRARAASASHKQTPPVATVHYDTATKTYSIVEDTTNRPYPADNGAAYPDYWSAQHRANWLNWNADDKQKNTYHSPEEQRQAEQAARTTALATFARTVPSNLRPGRRTK